jgi:hypothetical protein
VSYPALCGIQGAGQARLNKAYLKTHILQRGGYYPISAPDIKKRAIEGKVPCDFDDASVSMKVPE